MEWRSPRSECALRTLPTDRRTLDGVARPRGQRIAADGGGSPAPVDNSAPQVRRPDRRRNGHRPALRSALTGTAPGTARNGARPPPSNGGGLAAGARGAVAPRRTAERGIPGFPPCPIPESRFWGPSSEGPVPKTQLRRPSSEGPALKAQFRRRNWRAESAQREPRKFRVTKLKSRSDWSLASSPPSSWMQRPA